MFEDFISVLGVAFKTFLTVRPLDLKELGCVLFNCPGPVGMLLGRWGNYIIWIINFSAHLSFQPCYPRSLAVHRQQALILTQK